MRRIPVCLLAFLSALLMTVVARASTPAHLPSSMGLRSARTLYQSAGVRRALTVRIVTERARVHYWQRVMHRPLAPTTYTAAQLPRLNQAALRQNAVVWTQRARTLAAVGKRPPHLADWRCIQRHETAPPFPAWQTSSGNSYYGGLQMNRGFQNHYAPWLLAHKGTANHWSPLEQIWTAEYARASGRGFWPWPNTARACGLL